ncbi:MAG: hypothetical protein COV44_11000 [Deltaproteobacteria bacterium CG11_big_fil_rev_8_21_14_0_20_45_16]|nr:MAG: hypothetical protein COV44_11000 [Deltaproteobacteria bacterium CG11_big_fil_rev_8_21_14_0_20_45_16]
MKRDHPLNLLNWFFLSIPIFFLAGCGSSASTEQSGFFPNDGANNNQNNNNSTGNQQEASWHNVDTSLSSGYIDIPNDSASNAITRTGVPSGQWLLTRVKSQMNFFDFSGRMRFDHQFSNPGDPQSPDPYDHTADWGTYDPVQEGNLAVFIEHNLPLQLQGGGTSPSFTNRFYYFTEERTNDGWRWWIDDQSSNNGSKIYEFFKSGSLVGENTYEAVLFNAQYFGQAIATLDENILRLYTTYRINSSLQGIPQVTVLYEYERL